MPPNLYLLYLLILCNKHPHNSSLSGKFTFPSCSFYFFPKSSSLFSEILLISFIHFPLSLTNVPIPIFCSLWIVSSLSYLLWHFFVVYFCLLFAPTTTFISNVHLIPYCFITLLADPLTLWNTSLISELCHIPTPNLPSKAITLPHDFFFQTFLLASFCLIFTFVLFIFQIFPHPFFCIYREEVRLIKLFFLTVPSNTDTESI